MATSSGMPEYYAKCLTVEEFLQVRALLEHFGFRVTLVRQHAGLLNDRFRDTDAVATRNRERAGSKDQIRDVDGVQGSVGDEGSS